MLGLKKFLFKGGSPSHLPDDVGASLAAWRDSPAPPFDELHFHTRYIVVDIVSSGPQPDSDRLLGIAATSLRRGSIQPDDTFYVDFSTQDGENATVDRQLMAFLLFAAKGPLVTYHVPYVGGFLQRAFNGSGWASISSRSGSIMAWLLPSMFEEKGHTVMPLDSLGWSAFSLTGGGARRDAMANTLLLGTHLPDAAGPCRQQAGRHSGQQLVDESRASSFLRRNH
jgi:DNA polymerase-3 subunit epsilon